MDPLTERASEPTTEVVRRHDAVGAIVSDLRRLADDSGLLDRIRSQLGQSVQFDRLDVYTKEDDTLRLVDTAGVVVPVVGSTFERAIHERAPRVWMTLPSPTLPGDEAASAAGMKSSLTLPLLAQGDVVGLLVVYSRVPYAFSGATEAILDAADLVGQFLLQRRLRAMELALNESQRELAARRKLAAVGQLAGGVAHELNNPATWVLNNLECIAEDLARHAQSMDAAGLRSARESMSQMVAESLEGMRRIRAIVGDLQMYARPVPYTGAVRLDEVVAATTRGLASEAHAHGATMVFSFGGVPEFSSNRHYVAQVVRNLVLNSLQALRPDGGQVKLITRVEDGFAVFEVIDDGVGIPPAHEDRVFEPFFTTREVNEGTGLGLSISREIVRKLGGTIGFVSGEGGGTTFTVRWPLVTHAVKAPPAPSRMARRPRVLLIEDEDLVRHALMRALASTADVVGVESAETAVTTLQANAAFDVVLSDLQLPGMSGMDLYAHITDRYPALISRMVFVTAGPTTRAARAFIDEHREIVLSKPLELTALRAVISTIARSGSVAEAKATAESYST